MSAKDVSAAPAGYPAAASPEPVRGGPSRRSVLRSGAVAGLGLLAAPAIVSNAFASSGEVNFMGWSGYDLKALFDGFSASTGIKVNFLEQPDQDSMFAQCKLAQQTGAVDLAEPTVDRVPGWVSSGIVQPWDEAKLALDGYEPAFVTGAAGAAAKVDGRRYFVPSVWGTEALTYSTADAPMDYGKASLADLFDPRFEGKVTVRAHSGLAALGRVMEAQGRLLRPFLDSYRDEAAMTSIWDLILAEAIKHKANVVQFWNGENDAQAAFRSNGCTLGQTWDSTAFNLRKDDLPIGFIAPKEGAFAWLQGYFLMKNAANAEQAYAFVRYIASPEGSALAASAFSANPTGRGAVERLDPKVRDFYKAAYPGDALTKLWWWPAQPDWFIRLRGRYADRWKAA